MTKIKSFIKRNIERLVEDEYRVDFFFFFIAITIVIALLVSSFFNYLHDNNNIAIYDLLFAVTCILIILSGSFLKRFRHFIRYVFVIYLVVTSSFFLVMGGPDQTLLYWVLILPSFSYIAFGLKLGYISTFSVLILILLFYWTPFGKLILGPEMQTTILSARLRFTMIYLICALFGSTSEVIRFLYASQSRLNKEKLEYSLFHDSLTNVANQRYLEKYIETTKSLSVQGENLLFGCLFIDIDNFKIVNDQYGHLFGNTVLCRIADILSTKEEAFVCRWGGDEFVVCFRGTTENELDEFANYYRQTVAIQKFIEFPDFKTTISLGVKSIYVDEHFNFSKVLEIADREMRTEKQNSKILSKKL